MKELSIEEKAKAYDKALEKIHQFIDGYSRREISKEELEDIFPELKESKGEKIRKALIEYFRWNVQQILSDFDNKEVLAWLENIPYTIDHEKREGFHLGYKAGLEKQGETSPILSNSSNIGKDEQKPAWSEDDEKMIGRIRDIVEAYAFSQSAVDVNGDLCEQEYIGADNWLKSLKDKYTWKPSDEQMEALDFAANCIVPAEFCVKRKVLKELLEQLKKLREE